MSTEALLSGIGKAADELGLLVEEIDTTRVRFLVRRGKRDAFVTVETASYGPVDGDLLRAVIRAKETTDAVRE